MRDLETMSASKFEAHPLPIANMPDACWHLNFADLMEQFRRLGGRALAHNRAPDLASMPTSKIRPLKHSKDAQRADEANPLGLQESLHEFAAFSIPNSRGQTLIECGLHEADTLPRDVQGYLAALGASAWDIYEVVALNPAARPRPGHRAHGVLSLRRLHDDASIEVVALESGAAPQLGDIAGWRIFDAGGFLAATKPLPIPKAEVVVILSQWTLEASKWAGDKKGREAYLRERGNLLLINHCIRSARHRLCAKGEPAAFRHPEALVSPSESELPRDCWRRLGQAFAVLEISAAGHPGARFPHPFEIAGGGVLCVEEAADSWVATLFESGSAYREWTAVQHALAKPARAQGALGRHLRAIPQLRSWRARAEELGDRDIALLRELRLKPLENGAALGVRLDADWRWRDLDQGSLNRLIEALHTVSKQLRTGEGLAA